MLVFHLGHRLVPDVPEQRGPETHAVVAALRQRGRRALLAVDAEHHVEHVAAGLAPLGEDVPAVGAVGDVGVRAHLDPLGRDAPHQVGVGGVDVAAVAAALCGLPGVGKLLVVVPGLLDQSAHALLERLVEPAGAGVEHRDRARPGGVAGRQPELRRSSGTGRSWAPRAGGARTSCGRWGRRAPRAARPWRSTRRRMPAGSGLRERLVAGPLGGDAAAVEEEARARQPLQQVPVRPLDVGRVRRAQLAPREEQKVAGVVTRRVAREVRPVALREGQVAQPEVVEHRRQRTLAVHDAARVEEEAAHVDVLGAHAVAQPADVARAQQPRRDLGRESVDAVERDAHVADDAARQLVVALHEVADVQAARCSRT